MRMLTVLATMFTYVSAAISNAQVVDCALVVNEDTFNKRSVRISERLISNIKADICDRNFESHEAAKAYLRDGGWKLNVFGYFDGSVAQI